MSKEKQNKIVGLTILGFWHGHHFDKSNCNLNFETLCWKTNLKPEFDKPN
jgi:hypothetical protein